MKISEVSRRYAFSLFQILEEDDNNGGYDGNDSITGYILDELKIINQVIYKKEIFSFLMNPMYSIKEINNIFQVCFEKNTTLKGFSKLVKNFIFLLISKKRLLFLNEIICYIEELIEEKKGVLRGEVFSASFLEDNILQEIEVKLSNFFHKKILLQPKIDKKLIGGFLVNIGGMTFDGSVKHQFEKLKKEISSTI